MASKQVWVVAACFNEAEVISAFMERVVALPEVDHLLLIDDGSSDATVAVIRAWQQSHADQAVTLLELTRNFGGRRRRCWRGWTTPTAAVPRRC